MSLQLCQFCQNTNINSILALEIKCLLFVFLDREPIQWSLIVHENKYLTLKATVLSKLKPCIIEIQIESFSSKLQHTNIRFENQSKVLTHLYKLFPTVHTRDCHQYYSSIQSTVALISASNSIRAASFIVNFDLSVFVIKSLHSTLNEGCKQRVISYSRLLT